MRVLTVEESRSVLVRYPDLRLSDVPVEGLLLENEAVYLSSDGEGQVTLFTLDPNDE